jgi:tetratricopeptide (TPR) repeat protein
MNRTEFNNIIRNPSLSDKQALAEMKDVITLFPWFQSAHLILLKSLHDTGDIKFAGQLKESAFHVADREVLYNLINLKLAYFVPEPEKAQEKNDSTGNPHQEDTDRNQAVIESARNSEEVISVLEKEIAVPGNNEFALPGKGYTIEVAAESATDESASIVLLIENGDIHTEETITYMDPSITFSAGNADLLELDEPGNGIAINVEKEAVADTESDKRKRQQIQLIDKFIELNPRIEPVRAKSDDPVNDLSRQFTEERVGLVSETLAHIYTTQGYYSRAIDIYEKLCLKYPEKSSYFATQIEKVKALLK